MDTSERRILFALIALGLALGIVTAGWPDWLTRLSDDQADPFDKSRVATVRIVMADKDWQWLRANARMEQYVRGDFWFDGKRYPNVAVRAKGMSSLMSVADGRSIRLPLKVDFNFFNSARSFRGLTKVSLNNGFSDPTFIREMVGYEQFEQMGIPTPRCCFVDLYVNGDHLGLYTMAEPIDKNFLRRHFTNPNGNLYKPEMGACNLNWTKADYEKQLASQSNLTTPQKQDRTAINIGGTRLSDLLRLINRENGTEDLNVGQGMAGPFGGGPGAGPGGPMGQGGPEGFGPGMFLAPQIFTQADTNSDQKLTKGEFASLADTWFDKMDSEKTGKLNQDQFTQKLNVVFPPPPGFGGPGGGPGFGPAMFIGPMLFGILDTQKKGAISRTDLKSSFEKWYGQWDSDKSDNLTQEKLRDGLNRVLSFPQFGGAGGFGGFGGRPGGQGVSGPMGGGPGGFMPGGSRQNDIIEDLLLSDPSEFEERMNQQTLAARPGRPQNIAGGPPVGSMGQGGQGRIGGGPGGGFGGGPGGGPGPMGMFGSNLVEMMGLKTNENYANHEALFRFLDVLNKTPDESFPDEIEKVLDVDQVLRYFAASVMLVHLDNYLGMGHNYYLYENNGRFTILPWDLNMAFGTFGGGPMGGGAADFFIDEPVSGNMNDRPLVKRLLAHKPYLDTYHSYLEQMLTGCFAEGKIEARIDEIIALIRPYVEKDETKFVTMEQFELGITEGSNSGGGMGPFGGPGPQGQQANADLPSDMPEDLVMLVSAARSTGGENRRMGFGRGGPGGGGGPPGMTGPGLKSFISKRRVSVRAQLDGTKPSKLTDEQRQQQNQGWPMMGFGGMR